MPVFAYKGMTAAGKVVNGLQESDSARTLKLNLKRDGIFVTEIKEAHLKAAEMKEAAGAGLLAMFSPSGLGEILKRKNADKQQVAILTRQLGVLLKAGVPLSESLGALVEQSETPYLKRILSDVRQQVNEGSALADALARHPGSFEDLFINMIRAGEASGALESVLFRLAEFLESQNRLRSKVTSAMFYPIVMGIMGAGIITMLMLTVVPKVTAIFVDMGQALPWNTTLLIGISDLLSGYWWALFPSIFLVIALVRRYIRTTSGRLRWHTLILKLPVIGPLARMVAIARLSKTLSTMLSSGVPLLRALDIVKNILGNDVLTKVIEDARNSIKEGESIAAPLKRSGEFPPIVTHMIMVGERTGELESMLENVAISYEVEVDMKLGRLTTLLEPLMIMGMGGSVAFVVFSILQPILQMNEFVN